jgi:hypothetical protein
MTERDLEEQDLRIEQMTVNIQKLRSELKWEGRKVMLQTIIAIAAAVGAGIALGRVLFGT